MSLIKKVGGYDELKSELHKLNNLGGFTAAKWHIEKELLQYRRENNIFEVGDKVVGTKLFDDRIFEFQYYLPELSMAVISKDGAAVGLNQLRHATDAEIQAGHRLD